MKKALVLMLVFALLLATPVLANGADVAQISMGSASGYVGDIVSVDLVLQTNPGFGVLGLKVAYDSSKLQLVSVTDKKVFTNNDPSRPYTNTGLDSELDVNPYLIVWSDDLTLYDTYDTGKLATFNFKILAEAEDSAVPVTVSVLNCYKADIPMTAVPTEVSHGLITVFKTPDTFVVIFDSNGGSQVASKTVAANTALTPPEKPEKWGYTFLGWYKDSEFNIPWNFATDLVTANTTLYAKWALSLPGDIDGNGKVDLKDVTTLSRYIAGWDGLNYILEALDVNGDNTVDLKDVVLLSRRIAGWDL